MFGSGLPDKAPALPTGAAEDGLRVAAALAADGTPPQVRVPKSSCDENCGPWHEEENVLAQGGDCNWRILLLSNTNSTVENAPPQILPWADAPRVARSVLEPAALSLRAAEEARTPAPGNPATMF